MHRRSFVRGLIAAPVVITTPGLLMPIKRKRVKRMPVRVVEPIYRWIEISAITILTDEFGNISAQIIGRAEEARGEIVTRLRLSEPDPPSLLR